MINNSTLSFRYFYAISLGIVMALGQLAAQPYVDGGETRFRFAQMYVGGGLLWLPSNSEVSAAVQPRLSIGGIHFWGYADFSVDIALPVTITGEEKIGTVQATVGTGIRLHPLQLRNGAFSPFIGADWLVNSYQQQRPGAYHGPAWFRHSVTPVVGLSYMFSDGIIEASAAFDVAQQFQYPSAQNGALEQVMVPTPFIAVNFKYPFETTLSAEEYRESGEEERVEKRLATTGELNSFYAGAGVSSAFTLTRAPYLGAELPGLDAPAPPAILPELTVGWYHHDVDAMAQLAFRPINQAQVGHGIEQFWQRNSLTLEGAKFLFDYNGFVPFVGAGVGYESLSYTEAGETNMELSNHGFYPTLLFGWDIRPNRLQWFIIRTALRYTPALSVKSAAGNRIMFDHLEFNFFQFTAYLNRIF